MLHVSAMRMKIKHRYRTHSVHLHTLVGKRAISLAPVGISLEKCLSYIAKFCIPLEKHLNHLDKKIVLFHNILFR